MSITNLPAWKNGAVGLLTNSPGTSGTSAIVSTGQGARFQAGQPATLLPANTSPDAGSEELVTITAIVGDTLTIARSAESTSPLNAQAGWVIWQGITAAQLAIITGAIGNLETPLLGNSNAVVSGTTYTTVLGDANTYIDCTSGSATTITIPTNASVAYPVDTTIVVTQKGAGAVTVQVTGADTLNSYSPTSSGTQGAGGTALTAGQYAALTLRKVASTAWIAYGAK